MHSLSRDAGHSLAQHFPWFETPLLQRPLPSNAHSLAQGAGASLIPQENVDAIVSATHCVYTRSELFDYCVVDSGPTVTAKEVRMLYGKIGEKDGSDAVDVAALLRHPGLRVHPLIL